MSAEDLSPEAIDRRLRDLGELYAFWTSLATARLVEPDAKKSAEDDRRYAEAVASFHAAPLGRDAATAFPVILERARRGLAEAQCIVGNCYHLGLGRPADPVEAEEWYLRAAGQGYAVAINNLGTLCLARGEEDGARAWYEKAWELGFPHAPG